MQNKTHIINGLWVAAALIVFNATTQFLDCPIAEWTDLVFATIIITGVSVVVYMFKQMETTTTFNNAFLYGLKASAVVACIYFVYTLLSVNFFFPNFIAIKISKTAEAAAKQKGFDKANFDAHLNDMKKFVKPMHLAGTLMMTLILGVFGSLIGAMLPAKQQAQ